MTTGAAGLDMQDGYQSSVGQQHTYNYGVSTVNPTSHINRSQSSRINGRTGSEVVSSHPNRLLRDRSLSKTNNSLHDLENISCKRPLNIHNTIRNPMDLLGTANYTFTVSGQSLGNHENKVNDKRTKKVRKGGSESPRNMTHKVLIIGDSHMRSCAANVKSSMLNVKSSIKDNIAVKVL